MTQTFVKTSPYAHLLPPLSSFALHPITSIRDALSVVRLHIDYTTQQTNESRQQKILDAQKRRLYRRAHGLEDLDAAEEQGIDVRGLVPWDDGLTNRERAQGGRRDERLTGADVLAMGGQVGDDPTEFARKLRAEREAANETADQQQPQSPADPPAEQQPPRRKRKLWLGIW